MALCIVKDLLNPPPHHHHLFVPLEESGEGGRSHQLSANSRICPHPAGWNRPIKIKRFKPNRYIVNVVGSKVRRITIWLAVWTKSHCELLLTWRQAATGVIHCRLMSNLRTHATTCKLVAKICSFESVFQVKDLQRGRCLLPEHSQTFPPQRCNISCFYHVLHSFILTHLPDKRLLSLHTKNIFWYS